MTNDEIKIVGEVRSEVLVEERTELLIDTQETGGTVVDATENELLLDGTPDLLVVQEEEQLVLLETAEQGPPGPAGRDFIELPAAIALGGNRCVRALRGFAVYADHRDPLDAHAVLGITRGAVDALQLTRIQTAGLMTEPSWSWIPDLPVFVGVAGTLTQLAPATGFDLIVGVAITPTQIHIGARAPIVLE